MDDCPLAAAIRSGLHDDLMCWVLDDIARAPRAPRAPRDGPLSQRSSRLEIRHRWLGAAPAPRPGSWYATQLAKDAST